MTIISSAEFEDVLYGIQNIFQPTNHLQKRPHTKLQKSTITPAVFTSDCQYLHKAMYLQRGWHISCLCNTADNIEKQTI